MKYDTKSERLFSEICNRNGYLLSKLPTLSKSHRKSPDFMVETSSGKFIAEIKELTPNEEDKKQFEAYRNNDVAPTIVSKIGSRCRESIKTACRQLKTYRDDGVPLVVIIYDNVRDDNMRVGYPMFFTQGFHIDSAMYGNHIVSVSLNKNSENVPDRSGGGRTTTSSEKQYLSAVLVISDADDESILVYHNAYASVPFPLDVFADDNSTHFTKPDRIHNNPGEWVKLDLPT